MADKYLLQYTGNQVNTRLERPVPVSDGGTGQTGDYSTPTVTNDTTKASGHSIAVRYYPFLKMCFVRGYVAFTNVAVDANTWVTVATVPEAQKPSSSYPTPFATNVVPSGMTRINADGEIQVRFDAAVSATASRYVYFSGWWTTN
jgi:hypothetical protein